MRVRDPEAAIRLFDADFQQQLLGLFAGTAFELAGDLALVVTDTPATGFAMSARRGGADGLAGLFGRSGDRIRTSPDIVRALPTMRQRSAALLQAMPEGWWRGLALRGGAGPA